MDDTGRAQFGRKSGRTAHGFHGHMSQVRLWGRLLDVILDMPARLLRHELRHPDKDKIPPQVVRCPSDIWIEIRNGSARVDWTKPKFSDNVRLAQVEPGGDVRKSLRKHAGVGHLRCRLRRRRKLGRL